MHTQVEAFFYRNVATNALRAVCPIPTALYVGPSIDWEAAHAGSEVPDDGAGLTLIMDDMRVGFPASGGSLDLARARAGLEWLARFHAHHWQKPRPEGLWPRGTYWYLATRCVLIGVLLIGVLLNAH